MSNDELVGAYIEGAISRRTLIRKLVAAGVSLGAATAYAHHLAPKASAKGFGPAEYPRVRLRILTDTTKEVARDGVLRVRVRSSDPCTLRISATVTQPPSWSEEGRKTVKFGRGGGKKVIEVKIPDADQLNRRRRSEATVEAVSDEGLYQPVVALKTKELEG